MSNLPGPFQPVASWHPDITIVRCSADLVKFLAPAFVGSQGPTTRHLWPPVGHPLATRAMISPSWASSSPVFGLEAKLPLFCRVSLGSPSIADRRPAGTQLPCFSKTIRRHPACPPDPPKAYGPDTVFSMSLWQTSNRSEMLNNLIFNPECPGD